MTESPEGDQARTVQTHAAPGGLSRWTAPLALLVALVAVALAIWSLVSPPSSSSSSAPSAAQGGNPNLPGDSKQRVCAAFNVVSTAVSKQTHGNLGPDPVALTAVAANARLALLGGGQYLLNSLDSDTPDDLAESVRSFAYGLQDVGIHALLGEKNSDTDQAGRMSRADDTRKQIVEMCK